ncbi:MAG TPA: glutathione S-transferase [Sphingomicrobium sp.]|nr:glutathione S-transferase [Sphingomicrobium sp.]
MTSPADPILYSFRRCPYAMRARLALAVSGTRYELREVNLQAKPAEMLAVSPKATVPVLALPSGKVIDESLEIMHWALTGSDPEAWLDREDAALISANDGRFKRDLDRYKYPDRHSTDPLNHREQGLMFLRELERRLSLAGQLGGFVRGLTDAAIMPFVRQFAAVDAEWFNNQELPHLRAWLQGHLKSELFNSIMFRATFWSPGNLPSFFPR